MLTDRKETERLLYNVVHDLRTPLGNIEICAYLLGRKLVEPDDEIREYISAIQRQVADAERILRDAITEVHRQAIQPAEPESFSLTKPATAGVT